MTRKTFATRFGTGRRAGTLALALITAMPGPAALAGDASRPATVAPVALRPPAEAPPAVPLPSLATTVAAWVAAAMNAPLPELPWIDVMEPRRMAALRHGGAPDAGALEVVALYDDTAYTIHLPAGWTGATPAELSVLVHEMVHHVQNLGGRRYACAAEREGEAFDVQRRWLALFGTDLEAEFDLDPLTLLVLTRCGPH